MVAVAVLAVACVAVAAPSAMAAGITYKGAFEFEGLANDKTGSTCQGAGAFGVAEPGAKVTISEQNAAGDFSVLGTGKLAKGKAAKSVTGDKVCRMKYRVKAPTAPAKDSTVYLEVKGFTFNVRTPAAKITDGDWGTYICEYSDHSCATVVGG